MKLDLGQVFSIVANLGVIAGIVFLGLELQQNNQLLAAQARSVLVVQRQNMIDAVMSNPYILEASHNYVSGGELTPAERSAVLLNAVKNIQNWEWQYSEYRAGMLPFEEIPLGAWRIWFHGEGEVPVPVRDVWEERKSSLDPDFVQFMEENVVNER